MRFSTSTSSMCLILRSMGELELRLGHTLTSMSQGLSVSSIRISKPQSSKPQVRLSCDLEWMSSMVGSAAMQVLMMISLMRSNSYIKHAPYRNRVYPDALVVAPEGGQGPFAALAVLICFLVFHEHLAVLVDAEVGQVDEPLLDLLQLGGVLVRGEPHQPLLEHVYPQGVVAGHQHVYSQVVLQIVDQVWIPDVLAHQVVLTVADLSVLGDHLNAPPAGRIGWLHYPQMLLGLALPDHLEAVEVAREQVCCGHEVELLWVLPPHTLQGLIHVVLPSEGPAPREVVHLLKAVQVSCVLEVGAVDIEQYIPGRAVSAREPVEFEGVDDALVLLAGELVAKVLAFNRHHTGQVILDTDTFRIAEEYRGRAAREYALLQVGFPSGWDLVVDIFALVQLLLFVLLAFCSSLADADFAATVPHAPTADLLDLVEQLAVRYAGPREFGFVVDSNRAVHSFPCVAD